MQVDQVGSGVTAQIPALRLNVQRLVKWAERETSREIGLVLCVGDNQLDLAKLLSVVDELSQPLTFFG